MLKTIFYRIGLYRLVMRVTHRFNWHYMPPCHPDGDTMIVCHWCGARYVTKRAGDVPAVPV